MRMSKTYRAAVCVAILVLSGSWSQSFADERNDDASIVGTWLATTTVNVPGAPPFVFNELAAFNAGGTVVDTHAVAHSSDNPFLPPAVAVDSSDAFGSWRRQNDRQFAVTFKRLLFAGVNTPTSIYGPFIPGQHVGFETVHAVFTVQPGPDGGTLTGPFTVQFATLSGQVVFAASGTVSAKRVKIEPLVAP